MVKEVRKKAIENYKTHSINSWIIGAICSLFIAAIFLLGVLSNFLVVLFFPLIVLPFLFACISTHLGLSRVDEINGKSLFRLFALFFRPPFMSTFGVLRSFLKALLTEILVSFIVIGICYAIFSQSPTFNSSIKELSSLITSASLTPDKLDAILKANDEELFRFSCITNAISLLIASLLFIICILYEEITVFTRMSLASKTPLAHQIARATIKVNSRKYLKLYFGLNYPLFILIAIGMALGCLLSIYGFHRYDLMSAIGVSMGIAFSVFFAPFYFANQEAIFDSLSLDLNSFSEEYVKNVFQKFGIEVNGTQKEEENKKDPDEQDRNE